jgi:nucleoid-associated protein YgaU
MMSSGKKVSLLSVVAVAAVAAVLSAKKPTTDPPQAVRAEPRETLARRLPARAPTIAGQQHLLKTQEDNSMKVPTAATTGSADPHVGLEFSPSVGPGYGRSFNPAGAMLEHRLDVAENMPDVTAERGPQIDFGTTFPGKIRTHVVADGDTLTGLATRYLGSSERYGEIFAANRQVLTTPDLLPIGATLQIPSLDSGTPATSVSPNTQTPVTSLPTADPSSAAKLPATGIVPIPKGALGRDDD